MSLWTWLLNPSGLTAHGFCLNWAPGLVSLHVVSDGLIALAYFSIPLVLASFARQRPDLGRNRTLYLFVCFILACGMTHLFSIVTLWTPVYGVEGVIKLVTAILSVATAVILWPLLPRLVALPSPLQLQQSNVELSASVAELTRTSALLEQSEARSHASVLELESRVAEQTAALSRANAQLVQSLVEREKTLRELAAAEATFRASFEAAAVGKTQTDPATAKILRANAAFARMLGYEPEDMIGRSSWDFTWPEDLADDRIEYARLLKGEIAVYVREKRYRRQDGTPVWGRISAALVRVAEDDVPPLVVSVIENIDERYKATIELEQAKQELENLAEDRGVALQQRDILLREVYHRVKNNLQMIDSFLVMQARHLDDGKARDALSSLRRRVFALGLVHHQLMGSTNLRTFDVAPFLRELSGNILDGGGVTGVKLTVQAPAMDVGLDFAIPLGLLVTELVTNALKHAFPTGTGHVSVVLQRDADGAVGLIVSDNGQGMGPSGRQPITPGLGTSIIAGLVAQLQGRLTMDYQNGTRAEINIAPPVLL